MSACAHRVGRLDQTAPAISGVLSIAFGVVLLVRPAASALALVWMIGGYATVLGVLLISLGLRLNRWRRTGEPSIQTTAHASTTA